MNDKVSYKKYIKWSVAFVIALLLTIMMFIFTFTSNAAGWFKLTPAPFAKDSIMPLLKTVNNADVFKALFNFKAFGKLTPCTVYAALVVLALIIIVVIAQIITYISKKKPSHIIWILGTILFGTFLFESVLYFEYFIGTTPSKELIFANAKFFSFKAYFTFNAKVIGSTKDAIAYGIMLYLFLACVFATLISGIGMTVTSFFGGKAVKAPVSALNDKGSFAPDQLEAGEFEENVNNLNTIGTTSPLVVQYINSYGDQTKKAEAPVCAQPVAQPLPVVEQPKGLTKEDIKEVITDLIVELKAEQEVAKEAAPVVVPVVPEKVEEEVEEPEETPVCECCCEKEVCPCEEETCPCECECTCEDEDEDIVTYLVDEEGNEVEAIAADDLQAFIHDAVIDTLNKRESEEKAKEKALLDTNTINDPTVTAACDDVVSAPVAASEPEVEVEEPAQPSTIVVALPADYDDEPVKPVEPKENEVQDIEEVKSIIASEIKDALQDLVALKEATKPAPKKVVKVIVKEEPKPEVKEEPQPVVEETPVVEKKAQVTTAPIASEIRGSEAAIEKGEVIRLNFLEKVSSGSKDLVRNYNAIKNLLMSFGLKDRLSNTADTFRLHKNTFAKITTNGDAIKLYLALDPKDYMSTALPIQDVSNKSAYKEIPLAIKVKSELSLKRATELVYACMRQANIEQIENSDMDVDYVSKVRRELKKIENSKR